MKATDYPILLVWSEEDHAYLARVIDLPGCIADGETPEQALANARVVIDEWVETARELGRDVPPPSDDKSFRESVITSSEQDRKDFEEAVEETARAMIDEVLPQIITKVRERVEAEQPRRNIFFSPRVGMTLLHSD